MKEFIPSNPFTELALRAAKEAGELLRKGLRSNFSIREKGAGQNLVTDLDTASEDLIRSLIAEYYPSHAFLGEEGDSAFDSEAEVLWIVDPLDGTVNFAHRLPIFSTSIAAAIKVAGGYEVISAVVYAPETEELFVAEKGRGSYCNGERLSVSSTEDLRRAFIATGIPYNISKNPHGCIDILVRFTKEGIPVRRLGAATLDLCYTAAGRFDAYWEVFLEPWDIAAGLLMVKEAGGKLTNFKGSPYKLLAREPVLASNKILHPFMMSYLA